MNVLHVAPSFGMGGREMRAVALMGMMPAGTRHRVIAHDGRADVLARKAPGVEVEVIGARPQGGAFARLAAMRRTLRTERPDLLLTYNWGTIEWLLAARLEKLRAVVHHEDGFGPDEAGGLLRRRAFGRRALLPACRAVVVPSRTLYEIARTQWGQREPRLRYLPNGVDVQRFRPAKAPQREIVFGCVGAIRGEKNQALAVAAFARAQCRARARLRIVGDGPERQRVAALANDLGVADRVDFIGQVDDTAPEYRQIDVFVIPSRTEQMPLALLEAMASGLPVAGTDVGDVRAIVAEENRRFIGDLHAPEALARELDALAADPAERARLGAANRARAESEFEIGRCYGAYVELYLAAAAGRQ